MKQSNKALTLSVLGAVLALGVGSAVVPSALAADQSTDTVINAVVGSAISISTSTPVDLMVTPTSAGSATSASDTVTVSTNNATGYELQLANKDANTDLVSGSNTISSTSGTFASPAALANNSWGFRVDGAGTFGAGATVAETNVANLTGTWAAVPASGSPVTLKTTSSPASSDITNVWYGVKVDTTKPNGTYTDTVTYTAVTN